MFDLFRIKADHMVVNLHIIKVMEVSKDMVEEEPIIKTMETIQIRVGIHMDNKELEEMDALKAVALPVQLLFAAAAFVIC